LFFQYNGQQRFLHNGNGFLIELSGSLSADGTHRQLLVKRLQKTVSHLASTTVSCAENQYSYNQYRLKYIIKQIAHNHNTGCNDTDKRQN